MRISTILAGVSLAALLTGGAIGHQRNSAWDAYRETLKSNLGNHSSIYSILSYEDGNRHLSFAESSLSSSRDDGPSSRRIGEAVSNITEAKINLLNGQSVKTQNPESRFTDISDRILELYQELNYHVNEEGRKKTAGRDYYEMLRRKILQLQKLVSQEIGLAERTLPDILRTPISLRKGEMLSAESNFENYGVPSLSIGVLLGLGLVVYGIGRLMIPSRY